MSHINASTELVDISCAAGEEEADRSLRQHAPHRTNNNRSNYSKSPLCGWNDLNKSKKKWLKLVSSESKEIFRYI